MAREDLSAEVIAAMMGRETGVVVLYLLDITHEDLDTPIRLVNNTEDVISGGNTYTAIGFDVLPPNDKDAAPRGARLSIDNASQWFTPTLRTLSGEFLVTIKLAIPTDASASPPVFDGVEIEYLPAQLLSLEYDDVTVSGTLSYENLANAPYPGEFFNPQHFQGLF